jgi:hypothetical protein
VVVAPGGGGVDANRMPRTPSRRLTLWLLALAGVLALTLAPRAHAATQTTSTASIADNQKRVCVYDVNSVSGLDTFAALTGRSSVDCAMVYTGSPDWAGWIDPWFLHHPNPDLNWAAWVRNSPANDRRQLIISQPLIPTSQASTDWLDAGANGDYTQYAKQFAQNLVADGVSDAVIRLSWEMNGTWNIDSIPNTPAGDAKWIQFWRLTVQAMRSVPGQHFLFDWCPNNGYRPIALTDYYPGDDVVDIIGDDPYDAGVPTNTTDRWGNVLNRAGGLQTILDFAKAHNKPISLPEWGVGTPTSSNLAGGDDPTYIQGLANLIANNNVAFQTYFYAHEWATELQTGPQSLTAYKNAFGNNGYATGPDNGTDTTPIPTTGTNTATYPVADTTPTLTTRPKAPATKTTKKATVASKGKATKKKSKKKTKKKTKKRAKKTKKKTAKGKHGKKGKKAKTAKKHGRKKAKKARRKPVRGKSTRTRASSSGRAVR